MKKTTSMLPLDQNQESELNSKDIVHSEQSKDFDLALLNEALNNEIQPIDITDDEPKSEVEINDNDVPIEVETASIDRRKAYGKLSMEEKFRKARRTKWFKSIRNKVIFIYFFPKNKKLRLKQQKQIFIRRFNEFFGTNYRIDTVSSEFETQYRKFVDSKGFIWAVRYWILIVGIIVLPIALYFIISGSQGSL